MDLFCIDLNSSGNFKRVKIKKIICKSQVVNKESGMPVYYSFQGSPADTNNLIIVPKFSRFYAGCYHSYEAD